MPKETIIAPRVSGQEGHPVPRNAYWRESVPTRTVGESLTEQHHARSCDINTIMLRYQKTGVLEHVKNYEPKYGDVSNADFLRAANVVAAAKTEFEEFPAYVRKELSGGVEQYLSLMQTDEGVEALRGILHPGEKYTKDGSPDTTLDQPEALSGALKASEEAKQGAQSDQDQ